MTTVGFIGLGEQGKPMAVNLARDSRFDLTVYDLRTEPMNELAAVGAKVAASPREVAANSEIIEIIVVNDAQVEAVVYGPDGVLEGAQPDSVIVIHSTVRPATVHTAAERAAERGVKLIDAAVSGGARGAETRNLCYMVGGDQETVARCRRVFETSASENSIFHVGAIGAGMTAKLAHQVIICLNILAAHEGMRLGAKAGIDLKVLQDIVRAGGAQSRIADHWVKYPPKPETGVLFYKDLALALEFAHEMGLSLPGAAMTQQLIESVVNQRQQT